MVFFPIDVPIRKVLATNIGVDADFEVRNLAVAGSGPDSAHNWPLLLLRKSGKKHGPAIIYSQQLVRRIFSS